jgi:hypothetical protein
MVTWEPAAQLRASETKPPSIESCGVSGEANGSPRSTRETLPPVMVACASSSSWRPYADAGASPGDQAADGVEVRPDLAAVEHVERGPGAPWTVVDHHALQREALAGVDHVMAAVGEGDGLGLRPEWRQCEREEHPPQPHVEPAQRGIRRAILFGDALPSQIRLAISPRSGCAA